MLLWACWGLSQTFSPLSPTPGLIMGINLLWNRPVEHLLDKWVTSTAVWFLLTLTSCIGVHWMWLVSQRGPSVVTSKFTMASRIKILLSVTFQPKPNFSQHKYAIPLCCQNFLGLQSSGRLMLPTDSLPHWHVPLEGYYKHLPRQRGFVTGLQGPRRRKLYKTQIHCPV